MTELLDFISSVGFPAAMCILMYLFQNKTIGQLEDTIEKIDKSLALLTENIKTLTHIVEENHKKGDKEDDT